MKRTEEALAAALEEIKQSRMKFRQAAKAVAEPQPPAALPPELDIDDN